MSFDPMILKTVKRELKTQQARLSLDALETRRKLADTNPRLREIDAELYAGLMDSAASGTGSFPDNRRDTLLRERDDILHAFGHEPGAVAPSACPLCGGTLYVDGAACACLKAAYARAQTKKLSESLDLDIMCFERFELERYSDVVVPEYGISPRANMEILLETCRDYAENFEQSSKNLFFNGGVGLGKTFLSACIAGYVSRLGLWTVYETAISLFAVMESNKFDREDADLSVARAYLNCDLLVIDDLGTEFPSSFVQTALYHVVNSRLCARKKTIINSNLMLADFRQRYAPQTVSRIEGEYELMFFFGEDLRTLS